MDQLQNYPLSLLIDSIGEMFSAIEISSLQASTNRWLLFSHHLEVRVSTLECGEEQWTKEHLSKSTGTFLGGLHWINLIEDGVR